MNDEQSDKKLTKKERRELKKQEKQKQHQQDLKQKKIGKVLGWVILLVIIAVSLWGIMQLGKKTTPTVASDIPIDEIVETDHVKGATESAVLMVEYSDFQCPACGAYQPMLNELYESCNSEYQMVYRHFPLRNNHKNAQRAAEASEAAAKQGKFWEMHDLLFERQTAWSDEKEPTELFAGYAEELGLNVEQFRTDINEQSVADKVNNDFNSGAAADVNGTPTFFINGEKLQKAASVEDFKKAIDDAKQAG